MKYNTITNHHKLLPEESSLPEVFLEKAFRKYTANLQENLLRNFIEITLWVMCKLYWNHTLVFFCKFAAYFRNTFS